MPRHFIALRNKLHDSLLESWTIVAGRAT